MSDKRIRMVALDLDGTTLDAGGEISRETREALQQAMAQGVHIIISTGRSFFTIPEEVLKTEGLEYIINSNGADITALPGEQSIYQNYLCGESVDEILRLLRPSGLSAEAVIDRRAYIDRREYEEIRDHGSSYRDADYVVSTRTPVDRLFDFMEEHRERIENINLTFARQEEKQAWYPVLSALPQTTLTTSFSANYEIGGATTSKAEALRFLLNRLGIEREELMACGDSHNDMEMLKFAGLGIAMGNAEAAVKAAADDVTETNVNHGVAEAIRRFVLR